MDSAADSRRLTVQNFELPESDDYRFAVYGADNSIGTYQARLLLNGAFESEGLLPIENGSAANGEALHDTAIALGTGTADRSAILGSFESQFFAPSVVEDFEAGGLSSAWTTDSSQPSGTVEVRTGLATPNGVFGLAFGAGPGAVMVANEATWSVNVADAGKPVLRFRHVSWDQTDDPLPDAFAGSVNGDGVSFSVDGSQWYRLSDLLVENTGVWQEETIDLHEAVRSAGIAWNFDTIQLKFQNYGQGTATQGGRAIDDLRIEPRESGDDWYRIELNDGQSLSLVATQLNSEQVDDGPLSLELYAADGQTRLAIGSRAENATAALASYRDRSTDGIPDQYYARISGQSGEYLFMALRDTDFDFETRSSATAGQMMHQGSVLGFVTGSVDFTAEPDSVDDGISVSTFFSSVNLAETTGGSVRVRSIGDGASTGTQVFAHADGGVTWSENGSQLRADFNIPMDYVSIDVVADDTSDIGILRAYDTAGVLLGEIVSPIATPDQPATMSIIRPTADIGYVIMSGYGNDTVLLDNLAYGEENGPDQFLLELVANEPIVVTASSPARGPYVFPGDALFQEGNVSLEMQLFDSDGVLQSTGGTSLNFTAAASGTFVLTVSSTSAPGEYFIEVDRPLAPSPGPRVIAASTPLQPAAIGAFPSTYTVHFSDTLDLTSVQPADLEVNGFPAVSIASLAADQVTFLIDGSVDQGAGTYTVSLAADVVLDVHGHGNEAFSTQFTLEPLAPFEPVGIAGGQAYVSRNTSLSLDGSNAARFSLFLRGGETLSAWVHADHPLATLSLDLSATGGNANAPGAGGGVALEAFTPSSDQFVTIVVDSDIATDFELEVYRNINAEDLSDGITPIHLEPYLNTFSLPRYHAIGVTDGFVPDELLIDLVASSENPWDFVIQGTAMPWTGTLQLVDPMGLVVAEGLASSSIEHDLAIQDFFPDQTGTYVLRIGAASPREYAIMARAGVAIDSDTSPIAPLRDLTSRASVIGSTATGNDVYRIYLAQGETLILDRLPVVQALTNILDPEVTANQLVLRDPSGQVVAPLSLIWDANSPRTTYQAPVAGPYELEVIGAIPSPEYALRLETSGSVDVDFDNDGIVGCLDVGPLAGAIAAGEHDRHYDLDDNGLVDIADLNLWRSDAATANGLLLPYKPGDANLNGFVDVADFNIWNSHRFTETGDWCLGDFNANGVTDISDFNIWNSNKFMSSIAANVTISDASTVEGEPLLFDVALSRLLSGDARLNLVAGGGSAQGALVAGGSADFDYHGFEYSLNDGATWLTTDGNSGSEVLLPAGTATFTVRINTFEDAEDEPDEFFWLDAFVVSGAIVGIESGRGTIIDNDDAPSITIGDATAEEGDALVFPVTIDSPVNDAIRLDFLATSIDATANEDFETGNLDVSTDGGATWQPATGLAGTEFVVPLGTSQFLVRVDTLDDDQFELDETFVLTAALLDGDIASITDGVGTIQNNDPAPSLTFNDAIATEGENLLFVALLDRRSYENIVVDLMAFDGSASGGTDYDTQYFEYSLDDGTTWQLADGPSQSEVTFGAGSLDMLLRFPTVDDDVYEPTESMVLSATPLAGTVTEIVDGNGFINDDEPLPSLSVSDVVQIEGQALNFTLTLDIAASVEISLALATTDIDAVGGTDPGSNPGLDYDNVNLEYFDGAAWQPVVAGQVTLPAGTTTLDVRVATFDDAELEGDETFELTATEIVAGSLAVPSATATGTILDNESAPTLTIANAETDEGDFLTFTLTLDAASPTRYHRRGGHQRHRCRGRDRSRIESGSRL